MGCAARIPARAEPLQSRSRRRRCHGAARFASSQLATHHSRRRAEEREEHARTDGDTQEIARERECAESEARGPNGPCPGQEPTFQLSRPKSQRRARDSVETVAWAAG